MAKAAGNKKSGKPKPGRPFMLGYGILDAKKGRGLLPWSWAVPRLAAARNYLVSTTRKNGRPHSMPVWGVWIDDIFYFSTGQTSRKARNLAQNPRCTIAILHEDDEESIIVEGEAKKVSGKSALRRFGEAYQRKYDWDMSTFNEPIYAVRPQVAFAFGAYHDFVGTATRWVFPKDWLVSVQTRFKTSSGTGNLIPSFKQKSTRLT